MISKKSIQIQNIYYMLSYAFRVLKHNDYDYINSEEFENIYDLLSELFYRGVSSQLKQGLKKDYIPFEDDIYTIRGRISFKETLKLLNAKSKKVHCEYDEFSENNLLNQIVKSTLLLLISVDSLDKEIRIKLNNLKPFFDTIDTVDIQSVNWKGIVFNRNNHNYRMIINICYFIANNLLLTEEEGKYQLKTFTDEQLNLVFQNFVLNYYKEYLTNNGIKGTVNSSKVKYSIDFDKEYAGIEFLPEMQTDILINIENKALIIDTKFYGKILQSNRDKNTYHSNNLAQINNYVSHYSYDNSDLEVTGMLLYARTNEDVCDSSYYNDIGHWFYIDTLDLNKDFSNIKLQLDGLLEKVFFK